MRELANAFESHYFYLLFENHTVNNLLKHSIRLVPLTLRSRFLAQRGAKAFALVACVSLAACGGSSNDSSDENTTDQPNTPTTPPVVEAPESQVYQVTIDSLWSANDHISLPGNAHFSPVAAVSHSSDYRLLPFGELASPGLESLAELGAQSGLIAEAEAQKVQARVGSIVETQNQFVAGTPSQSFTITISEEYPLLSFASMIAPSPDWMIGEDSIELYTQDGGYLPSVSLELYAINAGTEEGDQPGNYSLGNAASDPQTPVALLDQSIDGFDKPFARVTIALQGSE